MPHATRGAEDAFPDRTPVADDTAGEAAPARSAAAVFNQMHCDAARLLVEAALCMAAPGEPFTADEARAHTSLLRLAGGGPGSAADLALTPTAAPAMANQADK